MARIEGSGWQLQRDSNRTEMAKIGEALGDSEGGRGVVGSVALIVPGE